MNGQTSIITPMMVGILRTAPIDLNNVTDKIPIDYTVNALISVMWDIVNRYGKINNIHHIYTVLGTVRLNINNLQVSKL